MSANRLSNLTETEIYQFFGALLNNRDKAGVYSVIETAEAMKVPYEKVKAWTASNEEWKTL